MAKSAAREVVGLLRRAMLLGTGQTDAKLLAAFVEDRDQTAFEGLVRRHGPMVLGVCRRVLGNHQDAEDAFQATFIVLVRKANSVVPRELVGNWLYGVAHQTAIRVKATNSKRRCREKQVRVLPEMATHERRDDLAPLLDQELRRLPEKYRVPIVLCDLEGRTRREVAEQLGWPEGSVSTRLARGRAMLAKRLATSYESLAVLMAQNGVSTSLVKVASGYTATTKVAAIAEGVLMSMLFTKVKSVAVLSFIVCVLGMGVGASFLPGQTQLPIERKREPNNDIEALKRRIVELEVQIRKQKAHLDNLEGKLSQKPSDNPTLSPVQPPTPLKKEIQLFSLRNLKADEVAKTLEQLFPLRVTTIPSRNTVIVQGNPDDLASVREFISRLEELPIQPENKRGRFQGELAPRQ